jgi:DNA repair protein RecO (recombination protein O)
MAIERCEGIVLRTYPLGDTSRIVVVYTREHGLMRLVAKGARKTPSRFGFSLEPLSRSTFVVYWKANRELHLLSQAETLSGLGSQLQDLERLAHAQAALELVDRLVWGEEPQVELYELLTRTLEAVRVAPQRSLTAVTLAFQLQVASLLGYRPRLEACTECGGSLSPRRLFSPARGGMLCDRCAATEAGVVSLSADALAGLSLLMSRPVGQASEYLELARAGEILRVVETFLRHHFQRFQGLNALAVLRGTQPVATPDDEERAPCPN